MYKIPCQYCKGKGNIPHFTHVENGICFTCGGSGAVDASEEVYQEYMRKLALKKQGSYIVFNNGSIEYFKTEKEIYKKYGNFYSGTFGECSASVSYKDNNIIYFHISVDNTYLNEINNEHVNRLRNKLQKQIEIAKSMLINESNQEFIEIIKSKIDELELQLSNL